MNEETRQNSPTPGAFESEGDEQVVQYGAPSALAIVSLILGLASPLSFFAPLLLAIPIFGAALAIVAMLRIAASEGTLVGRRAAVIALALCVVSAVAAVSRGQVLHAMRYGQARKLADQWVSLIAEGQIEPAFRLTVRGAAPESKAPPGMPADSVPKVDPLTEFRNSPVVQAIREGGGNVKLELAENVFIEPRGRGECVLRQVYRLTSPEANEEPVELVLTMQYGRLPGESAPRWLVVAHELVGSAEAPGG